MGAGMSRRGAAVGVLLLLGLAVGAGVAAAGPGDSRDVGCAPGEFCLWDGEGYRGGVYRVGLDTANPGECVPLPEGMRGRSFVNDTSRPVTVYQGAGCSTEGEFDTYPGGGTYVPAAPYLVRAVQIWEN